jgi:RNA polymerase sigma factor (sigma-70 family)
VTRRGSVGAATSRGNVASMDLTPSAAGERLLAQGDRLRLLLRHLAGPALRERVEPEDLVQETFLRVIARPEGLPAEEPGDAGLWRLLVHVARHVVVDAARAARASKRGGRGNRGDGPRDASVTHGVRLQLGDWSSAGPHASQLLARTAGPATRAIGRETQAGLERAFLALSAEHRRVLGLRQLEGLSAEDTARRMGRSATAVHSLYRRALLAWEQALEGQALPGDST